MKIAAASALALFLQPAPCDHGVRGTSIPLDLGGVEAAYRNVAQRFTFAVEKAGIGSPLVAPFESGLPACRFGETRSMRVNPLPRDLVGKILYFGPRRQGDLWFVTRVANLRDAVGGVPASAELAGRLGVRCVPARVSVLSETEVEVAEE